MSDIAKSLQACLATAALLFVLADAVKSPKPPVTKFIGYLDANAQQELPIESIKHQNLTHLVVTNALRVDNSGQFYYRPSEHVGERPAVDLITALAKLPNVSVVVSLRGEPDDVALDELAEVDENREKFALEAASLARTWGASGLEVEWHSDDVAGGKASTEPFDQMEQYHFALLCRDLAGALQVAGGRTLSVATRPGRQEFADGGFVRRHIDWLVLRAYSMRSLGDPHHSSLKDMTAALEEWTSKGVPEKQLVLGTPLFGRPGASLHTSGDRNEALRRTWAELSRTSLSGADHRGDVFRDTDTGKVWWVSGHNTTVAKVKYIVEHGYGGMAFRDLHHDTEDERLSLVAVALAAGSQVAAAAAKPRQGYMRGPGPVLFQKAFVTSKTPGDGANDHYDEF